jgi:transposase InsO family protein
MIAITDLRRSPPRVCSVRLRGVNAESPTRSKSAAAIQPTPRRCCAMPPVSRSPLPVERVVADNGSAYRSRAFRDLLAGRGIKHKAHRALHAALRAKGLIEIVLPGGIAVRVDAHIDDRAPRCVLDALYA